MRAPPTDDERRRDAALAAALTVKSVLLAAGTTKEAAPPNVAAIAADAATSQGATPVEAGAIGIEFERRARELRPDELPRDDVVRAVADAAAAAANASGAMAETGRAMPGQTPPIDPFRLYRALSQIREWFPLRRLARDLGVDDPGLLSGQLAPLASDGYVRIENEHVYVTERGHRFLEYASLT